jgi:hypothetical protein
MQMGFIVVQGQPCPSCSGGLRFLWITLLKTLAENKFAYFFILFRLWKLVRNFKIINEINGLFPVHSFFPIKAWASEFVIASVEYSTNMRVRGTVPAWQKTGFLCP